MSDDRNNKEGGRTRPMTTHFQQQNTSLGFQIPKSAPAPQHGQKADAKTLKVREPRSYAPRPGH